MIRFHANPPNLFADKLFQAGIPVELLDKATRRYSSHRVAQLRLNPIAGDFDLAHLCRIHEFLFKGVSSTAGSVRQYGLIRKDVSDSKPYARPWEIKAHFSMNVQRIAQKVLSSENREYIVTGLAHFYNAVNYAHPFCDGNGRAAREFAETLANRKELSLKLEEIGSQDKQHWYTICHDARHGRPEGLIEFFRTHVQNQLHFENKTTAPTAPIPNREQLQQWLNNGQQQGGNEPSQPKVPKMR